MNGSILFCLFLMILASPSYGEVTLAGSIRDYPDGPYDFQDPRLFECHHCYQNIATDAESLQIRADDMSTNLSIITPEQLQSLFSEIRSGRGLGEGIDGNVINDGCLQRAHIINQRLAARGILSGKVYATGNSGALYRNSNGRLEYYTWSFHVAPTVLVRYGDRVQMMVLDPNFMERPATVSQWLQKQNQYGSRHFGNLFFSSMHSYSLNSDMTLPSLLENGHSQTYDGAQDHLTEIQAHAVSF